MSGIRNFNVQLNDGGDDAPLDLQILTPSDGSTVFAREGDFQVIFRGTASPAALAGVDVLLEDGSGIAVTQATPAALNDFSAWSATVAVSTPPAAVPANNQIPTPVTHTFTVIAHRASGNSVSRTVNVTTTRVDTIIPGRPRLVLAETVRLSSFLGDYGAAQVIQAFSLFPGESAKISISSYTKTDEEMASASSVVDSVDDASEADYQDAVSTEQTNEQDYKDSFNYSVGVEGSFSYGIASAKMTANVGGGTNSARQDIAKNVINATQKHAERRSNNRSMQVNTSQNTSTSNSTENSIERLVRNVNLNRTLNMVFRQMSQEYISLYHLTDVRVAFIRDDYSANDGTVRPVYLEASIGQLQGFLETVIDTQGHRDTISGIIKDELNNIWDYSDGVHSFAEEKMLNDNQGNPNPDTKYLRIRSPFISKYTDDATGSSFSVPGIILAVNYSVLRTEGVLVDAILGQGDALDSYSSGLQVQKVEAKKLKNSRRLARVHRAEIANKIIRDGDESRAEIYSSLFGCCPQVVHECGSKGPDQVADDDPDPDEPDPGTPSAAS